MQPNSSPTRRGSTTWAFGTVISRCGDRARSACWRVDAENSWPKVMERELRQGGLEIEIANLGAPGAGPREYAALAERAIPLLKPDLIVVAVLQADDLFQAADSPAEQQAPAGERVLRAFRAFYPN